MNRTRLLGMTLVFVLVVGPFVVLAQDDEPKMKEYVSKNGLLTVSYPEDWIVVSGKESEEFVPAVLFVNSEEASQRVRKDSDEAPIAGDAVIWVILLPNEEYYSATEMAAGFMEGTDSEVKEIELTEQITAAYGGFSDEEREGALIFHELGDGSLLVVTEIIVYSSELTDELVGIGKAVAASVVYTGTLEDLLDADDDAGTSFEKTLDGESLVAERCTSCHTVESVESTSQDEAGWTATVDEMIDAGASLDDDERERVITYLTAASLSPAFAQPDELQMKRFAARDASGEIFVVWYPEDWVASGIKANEVDFPNVLFWDSEKTRRRLLRDSSGGYSSGEAAIYTAVFPTSFYVDRRKLALPEDVTSSDLANAYASRCEERGTAQVSEVEEIELMGGITAVYVEFTSERGEGVFIFYQLGDDLWVETEVITYPGELTSELIDWGKAVAASVVYTGTAENLMSTLMDGTD